MRPLRTLNHVSCSLPTPKRKRTISSNHLLIFTQGGTHTAHKILTVPKNESKCYHHPFRRPVATEETVSSLRLATRRQGTTAHPAISCPGRAWESENACENSLRKML